MGNPFRITGPAVVSFSGGRTSGYMLWRVLQAHGGTLPSDVRVCMGNTGRERPETLEFVERCSREWSVPVTWLEYRYVGSDYAGPVKRVGGHSFAIVEYTTASRNGEPFEAVVDAFADFRKANGNPPTLPNVVQRFCTVEMKIRTLARCAEEQGWEDGWSNVVGLRADEPQRVAKARASRNKWEVELPLADAGVTEAEVLAFWRGNSFDLQLSSYEGNCDLCFLKSRAKIERIIREHPELADWWIEMEAKTGQRFRIDRPSYAAMLEHSKRPSLPMTTDDPDELSVACHCTD